MFILTFKKRPPAKTKFGVLYFETRYSKYLTASSSKISWAAAATCSFPCFLINLFKSFPTGRDSNIGRNSFLREKNISTQRGDLSHLPLLKTGAIFLKGLYTSAGFP